MGVMRRTRLTLAATLGLAVAAVPAYAAFTEVGVVTGETAMPDPSCPAKPCNAFSRTTGYQVKVGEQRNMYAVPADGRIVAWTIKLSAPTKAQVAFFDKNLGGAAAARLTVVRPGNKLYARVLAQGEDQALAPYFGQSPQFALKTSIPVKKGNVIALSTPTWVPSLAINQAGTVSWRATRDKGNCNDFSTPTAQTGVNNITRFFCLYRTARLTYTATVVTDPTPNAASRSVVVGDQSTAER